MKYNSYVIGTSPRSGSTLLCKLLAATGVAGKPESYFHLPSVSKWQKQFNLIEDATKPERCLLEAIFQAAITEGSLDTDMFGLRLQRHSFKFFMEKLAVLRPEQSSDYQRVHSVFGNTCFIHLAREDKVEQAVSYVKAEQSGLWHMASDGTELERQSVPQVLTYDPVAIRARVVELTEYERQWVSWFEREGIEPIRITYNELSANPLKVLYRVLERLGVDPEVSMGVEPGVTKLADNVNQDWVERFRS